MFKATFSGNDVPLTAKFCCLEDNMNADFSEVIEISPKLVHIDTTEGWNSQPGFVGNSGNLYVYSDYTDEDGRPVSGFKFGDGVTPLIDLPFVAGNDDVSGIGDVKSVNGYTGVVVLDASDVGAAPVDSPSLTGIPTAPTASTDTSNSQIATTEFVHNVTSSQSSLPSGGVQGDILMKISSVDYASAWVTPASSAEQDNTRPITAAAVYTEIGNINALLATI